MVRVLLIVGAGEWCDVMRTGLMGRRGGLQVSSREGQDVTVCQYVGDDWKSRIRDLSSELMSRKSRGIFMSGYKCTKCCEGEHWTYEQSPLRTCIVTPHTLLTKKHGIRSLNGEPHGQDMTCI